MHTFTTLALLSTLVTGTAPYPLDDITREVPARGKLRCDRDALVRYKGDAVRYHRPVTVHPAFKERLKRFEALVVSVAMEIYGRAPRRIVHMGTYNCRRIRKYPNYISEHGLGNAIDVAGFDFPALPKGTEGTVGLEKRYHRAFKVRMKRHWDAKKRDARHQRFLRTLGKRAIEADIFRVLLGPAWPGHNDHFHFDMSPYAFVRIFKD